MATKLRIISRLTGAIRPARVGDQQPGHAVLLGDAVAAVGLDGPVGGVAGGLGGGVLRHVGGLAGAHVVARRRRARPPSGSSAGPARSRSWTAPAGARWPGGRRSGPWKTVRSLAYAAALLERVAGPGRCENDAAMIRSGLSPANSCTSPPSSSPTSASAGSRTSSRNTWNCCSGLTISIGIGRGLEALGVGRARRTGTGLSLPVLRRPRCGRRRARCRPRRRRRCRSCGR